MNKKERKGVGRPKKGHVPVLIGFTMQNKYRMDYLLERLNKDRKRNRFSRTDIVNDSVASFFDGQGVPYFDREGVEL